MLNTMSAIIINNTSSTVMRNIAYYIYTKVCTSAGGVGRSNIKFEYLKDRLPAEAVIGGENVEMKVVPIHEINAPTKGAIFVGIHLDDLKLVRLDGEPDYFDTPDSQEEFERIFQSWESSKDFDFNQRCWTHQLRWMTGGSPSSWGVSHELSVEEFFSR